MPRTLENSSVGTTNMYGKSRERGKTRQVSFSKVVLVKVVRKKQKTLKSERLSFQAQPKWRGK